MQDLIQLFVEHFYKFLITGFFGFLTYVVNRFSKTYKESLNLKRKQAEEESIEQKLIRDALVSLLRFRANRLCMLAINQGFLYVDERGDLEDIMTSYAALGGNGQTRRRYEYVLEKFETIDRHNPLKR